MKSLLSLGLRQRFLLFFAFLATGSVIIELAALYMAWTRYGGAALADPFTQAGLVAAFGILALGVWIWFLFDTHVARAIQKLSAAMQASAHADINRPLDQDMTKYLGDLGPAAQALADQLHQTRQGLDQAVAQKSGHIQREKASLAGLLADVPEGVIMCSPDHQIMFYNGAAVDLLAVEHIEPALDRSVFTCLQQGPLENAYARLCEGEIGASTELICPTVSEGQVLSGRMRLLPKPDGDAAPDNACLPYVLTLRDITANLVKQANRQHLIDGQTRDIHHILTQLQTGLTSLPQDPAAPEAVQACQTHFDRLAAQIDHLQEILELDRANWWPISDHKVSTLISKVAETLDARQLRMTTQPSDHTTSCDELQITGLLVWLAEKLRDSHGASELALYDQELDAETLTLRLGWTGPVLPPEELNNWLGCDIDLGLASLSGRQILRGHAATMTSQDDSGDRALLSLALPLVPAPMRSQTGIRQSKAAYDFDLPSRDVEADLMETPLRQLAYIVFDTETTGLLPDQGDEIVQIAGMRLVNGKRVESEAFDSLVNPGRKIPASSTVIHGITDDMVTDADPIRRVGRRFHRFAEDCVLVAHNAPFDMAFLKRHEAEIGRPFDHPVLDTVLLSAVLFGQLDVHTLDALTDRLGITIPSQLRHTAMGDTVATAEAFEKMLPMLEARGLITFADILTETRKHGRLLQDLNDARLASVES